MNITTLTNRAIRTEIGSEKADITIRKFEKTRNQKRRERRKQNSYPIIADFSEIRNSVLSHHRRRVVNRQKKSQKLFKEGERVCNLACQGRDHTGKTFPREEIFAQAREIIKDSKAKFQGSLNRLDLIRNLRQKPIKERKSVEKLFHKCVLEGKIIELKK